MPEVSTHTHTHQSVLASTCQLTLRTLCGSMHACVFVCVHRDLSKGWTLPCGEKSIGRSCHLRYINANTQTCTSTGAFRVLTSPFFVLNSLHSLHAFCYFPFSFYPFSFLFCSPLWSLLFLLPLFLFLSEPDSLIDRVTCMCRRTKPAGSIQTRLLTIWRKGACSCLGTWHVASKMVSRIPTNMHTNRNMYGISPQLYMHTCKWLSKLSALL